MRFLADSRRRWYLLAMAWVVLLVLGYGGFVEQAQAQDSGEDFLDSLYNTLQLALLEYGGGGDNWRLEVARFAAPLMATGTLVQAASVVFRDQFQRMRLRTFRGHTIVSGLGASGTRLALALAADGRRVVGVDPNASGAGIAALRAHDVPCLAGDPTDPAVLRAVRADRAVGLVALCATDALNVSVVVAAREVPRDGRRPDLRCYAHLEDADLTQLLRGTGLGRHEHVRVEFFNLHEQGARVLLAEHLALTPDSDPHLVVVGLGQLGRALVVSAAQQWAELGDSPLVATLVDLEGDSRWQGMVMQHPALREAVEPTLLAFDVDSPTEEALAALTDRLKARRPSLVAVVLDDESLALSTGLFLHRLLDDATIPVVVRTRGDAGLGQIVTGDRFPGLELFPMLDKACSPAIIEGGVRERLARSMHDDHRARTSTGGVYDRSWERLTDEQRESSRRSADGVLGSITDLGLELVPLRHWGTTSNPLTDEEVAGLAEREHERWRVERESQGWTYGPERDDQRQLNPQLVDWWELSDYWREDGIARIQGMPAMLARAGFELARQS